MSKKHAFENDIVNEEFKNESQDKNKFIRRTKTIHSKKKKAKHQTADDSLKQSFVASGNELQRNESTVGAPFEGADRL